MSLGKAPALKNLHRSASEFCEDRLSESSIYRVLHRECDRLFPDETFADLFESIGRRSVPPRIVAVVMVLQRIEGLSDREAVDRFAFDLRWKYAAGGLGSEYPGFVHTVLVDMRARLRGSERPDRIFEVVLDVAKSAGLVGRKRVLDSTALYDAVATQDTVTMIRAAIRGVLRVADASLATELRAVLKRDDDYQAAGKPVCDWDDTAARETLIDALARDGHSMLAALDGRELDSAVAESGKLLATVLGQDLDKGEDGLFRIARRVAPDRVMSTVDPESRHGHKTAARGFDGYKGHIAIDPDSEIITATEVTAGNVGDATAAEGLLADILPRRDDAFAEPPGDAFAEPPGDASAETLGDSPAETPGEAPAETPNEVPAERMEVYGDASYGTADLVEKLEGAAIEANVKVQPPSARNGMFAQDEFVIDTKAGTVRCPNDVEAKLRTRADGSQHASFADHCAGCPLRDQCTTSKTGRQINVHPKHETLDSARKRQRDPEWKKRYRGTRPKVERKLAHMMRHRHGGRRSRMRGRARIRQDFSLLAAATNLKRLAVLGLQWSNGRWTTKRA
jgi:hypothetical protein